MSFLFPIDFADDTPTASIPFSLLGISLEGFRYFIDCCGRQNLEGLTVTEVNERFQLKATDLTQMSYCDHLKSTGYERFINKAEVFISHAWMFKFLDTFDTLVDYFSDRPNIFIWFDMFSNNQHKAVSLDFSWWTGTFMSAIKEFGETVMVITPWNNPHPLKRAWCLYEIYSTVITGGKFNIALSKAERKDFLQSIQSNPDSVNKLIAIIQLESSQAFKPQDKDNILNAVRTSCGFAELNTCVFKEIRKWVISVVEGEIKNLELSTNKEVSFKLKIVLADLYRQQGFLNEAEAIYLKLLSTRQASNTSVDEDSLAIMNRLGDLYYRKGAGAESLEYYMKCLDHGFAISASMETSIHEMDYLNKIMDCILSFPCCYSLRNRSPLLEPVISSTSSVEEIRSYYMLATLYYKQARRRKAQPMYELSIDLLVNHLGNNDPEILIMKSNLASLHFYESNYAKAEQILVDVHNQMTSILGEDHPHSLLVLQNLAYYHLELGQFDIAEKLYEKCIEKVISRQGQHAQGVRKLLLNRSFSLYLLHSYSQAMQQLSVALNRSSYEALTLLCNNKNPEACSCQKICVNSYFMCMRNVLCMGIPFHSCISSLSCCYCCGYRCCFSHVETLVCCTLFSTSCSYCCCCCWTVSSLQSCCFKL
jgi:tetratricopeptide (TPR) repeat protein